MEDEKRVNAQDVTDSGKSTACDKGFAGLHERYELSSSPVIDNAAHPIHLELFNRFVGPKHYACNLSELRDTLSGCSSSNNCSAVFQL